MLLFQISFSESEFEALEATANKNQTKKDLSKMSGCKSTKKPFFLKKNSFVGLIKKGKKRWFMLVGGVLYWSTKELDSNSDFKK